MRTPPPVRTTLHSSPVGTARRWLRTTLFLSSSLGSLLLAGRAPKELLCLLLPQAPSRLLGVSLIASPTAAVCFGVTVSSATTSAALLFLLTMCDLVVPLRICVVWPRWQEPLIGFECCYAVALV